MRVRRVHETPEFSRIQLHKSLPALGATVTESSTWPGRDVEPISQSHGHVEDSVTVAPIVKKALALAVGRFPVADISMLVYDLRNADLIVSLGNESFIS